MLNPSITNLDLSRLCQSNLRQSSTVSLPRERCGLRIMSFESNVASTIPGDLEKLLEPTEPLNGEAHQSFIDESSLRTMLSKSFPEVAGPLCRLTMVKRLHDMGRLQVASASPQHKRGSSRRRGGHGQTNRQSHWHPGKLTNQLTRFGFAIPDGLSVDHILETVSTRSPRPPQVQRQRPAMYGMVAHPADTRRADSGRPNSKRRSYQATPKFSILFTKP